MPAIQKRPQSITVRRSGPSPKLVKLQNQLQAIRKRGAQVGAQHQEMIATVAAPAVLAMVEKRGTKLPTVGGVDPFLLYGAVFALGGKKFAAGKTGKMLEAAGNGLLAAAAARSVDRGSVRVSGEDDEYTPEYTAGEPDTSDD